MTLKFSACFPLIEINSLVLLSSFFLSNDFWLFPYSLEKNEEPLFAVNDEVLKFCFGTNENNAVLYNDIRVGILAVSGGGIWNI